MCYNVSMSEKVISDYNGYDYKKIFWEDADREYEDQADRMENYFRKEWQNLQILAVAMDDLQTNI